VRWPSPKIKDTLSRSRSRRPSPGALAVAKDKRYALSGPSPGCAGRRQRPRQHEVKDRKMRVPLVSLVQYYLELTNCAGHRQVRWPSPKIKDTRSRWRSQRPSPGVLAVAKDKRYALSGPSSGALAVAKDRDNTKSKTERCAFHWSLPLLYYLELTNCAGRCQVALAVAKDKRYESCGM